MISAHLPLPFLRPSCFPSSIGGGVSLRLNRTNSTHSPKTVRGKASASSAQAKAPAGNDPTEQWTGGQPDDLVSDREAAPRSDSEEDLVQRFPGIAEGLSKAYLRAYSKNAVKSRAPLTLDPNAGTLGILQSENSVFRLSDVAKSSIMNCHRVEQHSQGLTNILAACPNKSLHSALFTGIFQNDSLLAAFCRGQLLGEPSLRQPWLKEVNGQYQLGFDHHDLLELESILFAKELFQEICQFSESYFAHRYGLSLTQQTKTVMSTYFPEIFRDIPLEVEVIPRDFNNASHEWVRGRHRLSLQYADSLADHRKDIPDTRTSGSFASSQPYRRGIADLISFVHEYAHGIYDEILGTPASIKMERVSRVLSEGFAVLLEILSLDHLAEDGPGKWSKEDIDDLIRRRAQRVDWLQGALQPGASESLIAYAEGIELMTNVYRQGGLGAIRTFLESVSSQKADSLSRSNPKYRESIPDPKLISNLIFKTAT